MTTWLPGTTWQTVKEMLEKIKESNPAVIEELVPEVLSMGDIQKVFQNLLREKIQMCIRDRPHTILD